MSNRRVKIKKVISIIIIMGMIMVVVGVFGFIKNRKEEI